MGDGIDSTKNVSAGKVHGMQLPGYRIPPEMKIKLMKKDIENILQAKDALDSLTKSNISPELMKKIRVVVDSLVRELNNKRPLLP